jgi:hypothetical protein
MDKIYLVRGTEQTGPFTEAEVRAQLASGAIAGDTLVWWEGLPEWSPISSTPLAATATPSPGPAPVPPAPAAAGLDSGAKKTSPLALTSLITGIVGLPAILCWPIALALDVTAIITGHMARGRIRKDPSQSGSGMALAGLICGYIGILLTIVVVVFSVLIALGSQKSVLQSLQSQINAAEATNTSSATPDTSSPPPTPDTNSADTNSAPAMQDTNAPAAATSAPTAPDTNSATTNSAPATQ